MTPAPKRGWLPDWLRYGPRWDLLTKTNPHATRQSVVRWAAIGALGGALVDFYLWYRFADWLPLLAIAPMMIGGALLGGLIEWQMDDHD